MTGSFRDLSSLLNPKSVAMVGASDRPGSAGRLVLENLKNLNYPGKVYAVNPIPSTSIEVILGVRRDAEFGPVVIFGSGGILIELVKDSVLRFPPTDHCEAISMIGASCGAKLLRGFRGRPAADVNSLATALVGLS